MTNKKKIEVYTEWDPLKEVIVGNCLGFNHERLDATFHFMYRNWYGDFEKHLGDSRYEMAEQIVKERQEDLNNLQKVLEERGIVVRRPKGIEGLPEIKGPHFSTIMNSSDAPRDAFIVIGNAIIETPPTNTKRFFESVLYRDIFMDYFRNGAQWIVAPRPTFAPNSLDFSFWEDRHGKSLDGLDNIDSRFDIAFDAANCMKFGKHIIMNVGTANHELGYVWLQDMLHSLGYDITVHARRITDSHIDWQFIPLKPGKLLVHEHYMKDNYHLLPEKLQKWDRIPIQDKDKKPYLSKGHIQVASSQGMDINVLSLNENDILIRDTAVLTMEKLYQEGFNPIPIQFRHCELFGDAIHCATLDTRRKGELIDYFE